MLNIFTRETIDGQTGELLTKTSFKKTVIKAEKFIRIYFPDLKSLATCNGSEIAIIIAALRYVEWDTNIIMLNAQRRIEIAHFANISPETVKSVIPLLYKRNLWIKLNGHTVMNPNLLFFGSDMAKMNLMKERNYKVLPHFKRTKVRKPMFRFKNISAATEDLAKSVYD